MKILGLDSSGLVASVAVVEDENLLAEFTVNYKKTHSQTLLPMLDQAARMIELDLASIDAIALAAGPGSFTGLRIGAATAKGLGLALDKPLISVPTVDALAYNLWGAADVICPLMDARRSQTYTGLYRFAAGELEVLRSQCVTAIEDIVGDINGRGFPVVFLGDGVPVFRSYIQEHCRVPYSFAPAHLNKQRAAAVAALGERYYAEGRTEAAEDHRPEYLRLSQAERERMEQQKLSGELHIRPMKPADVPEAAAMERQYFGEPWSEQGFLDALQSGHALFLAAQQGEELVGYCGAYLSFDEGEITNVAVREDCRGKGIGRKLLEELQSRTRAQGVRTLILEVRVSNREAIRLYGHCGFRDCGLRQNFYRNPQEDARLMKLDQ